jgi:hypothetical protein
LLALIVSASAQEADDVLNREHWMQPVKTAPWPEEEADTFKKMRGMALTIGSPEKESKAFCETMADDLLAVRGVEYVPPVSHSLFYDTEEMKKLMGACFYKVPLDVPGNINLASKTIKFLNGFKVFMGNFDNISENGNEVIIFADGGVSKYGVDEITYRQQLRLRYHELVGLVLFVFSPAESCSEKYNPSYIYTQAVSIISLLTYFNDTADKNYYGVFRYSGREFAYVLRDFSISIYWKDSVNEKPLPAWAFQSCYVYVK